MTFDTFDGFTQEVRNILRSFCLNPDYIFSVQWEPPNLSTAEARPGGPLPVERRGLLTVQFSAGSTREFWCSYDDLYARSYPDHPGDPCEHDGHTVVL